MFVRISVLKLDAWSDNLSLCRTAVTTTPNAALLDTKSCHVIVVDLTSVYRIETSVAQYLERQGREFASQPYFISLVLAGFNRRSDVHANLLRGGINCRWVGDSERCGAHVGSPATTSKNNLIVFRSLKEALCWSELPGLGV